MRTLALAAALLLAAAAARAAPLSDWHQGVAKQFGGPQDNQDPNQPTGGLLAGSCGYGQLARSAWPYWSVAAISPQSFLATNTSRLPKGGCGACLQLQCINAPGYEDRCPEDAEAVVTVEVVDTCSDCSADKMAIHYLAFHQKLADPGFGEVAIRYRQVECNPGSNITLDIDIYRTSEGGYMRLAVEGTAGSGAVQAVELRKSPAGFDRLSMGSQWVKMALGWGARWELSGIPPPPLDLRITGDDGEVLLVRHAIQTAGDTGRFTTPVQFSAAGNTGFADGTLAPGAKLRAPAECNDTLYSALVADPDFSTLLGYVEKAGASKMLQDAAASATLFAPINSAWAKVPASVNLDDMETLQHVLLFLLAPGQVVMPDTSMLLPEDLERGGVKLSVDTLQGTPLSVLAAPSEIRIADGSSMTSDAIVVESNQMVCNSVLNVLSEVPMPFP